MGACGSDYYFFRSVKTSTSCFLFFFFPEKVWLDWAYSSFLRRQRRHSQCVWNKRWERWYYRELTSNSAKQSICECHLNHPKIDVKGRDTLHNIGCNIARNRPLHGFECMMRNQGKNKETWRRRVREIAHNLEPLKACKLVLRSSTDQKNECICSLFALITNHAFKSWRSLCCRSKSNFYFTQQYCTVCLAV